MPTKRICLGCGGDKEHWDYLCAECRSSSDARFAETDTKQGETNFRNMRSRTGNRDGHHPTYSNVECRIDREVFIAWFVFEMARFRIQHPGKRPSVDRIVRTGHYEHGNIRLLPLGTNCWMRDYCLTDEDVRTIRWLRTVWKLKYRQIATAVGTSVATVCRIIKRRSFCDVK